jgi:hypothetical protein
MTAWTAVIATPRAEEKEVAMDRRHTAASFLGLVLAVFGIACTSTKKVDTSSSGPDTNEACFDVRRVDSFSPLHERFVYVRAGSDEHYLLTMDRYCTGLPYAIGIRLSGDFSRVCSDTGATITYMYAGNPTTCRILHVESTASKEAAQKRVEDRTPPGPS